MEGLFDQLAVGHAPLITGRTHTPMTGMEGIPGMQGEGITGLLSQLVLGPMLQRLMGQYGAMPLGLGHERGVLDVLRNQRFTQAQQTAMEGAATLEAEGMMQTLRGMAVMTGTPWGAQQRRAARHLTDTAELFAPAMAIAFPEMMDQLGGLRGSPTVMAHRMMMGGRYAIDPVTGMVGMSGESGAAISQQLFQQMFQEGDLADLRGMTAGQAGHLYDELTRRGMIPGETRSRDERITQAARDWQQEEPDLFRTAAVKAEIGAGDPLRSLSAEQLDKLQEMPEVEDRLRGFEASRVQRSLEGYSRLVGTMREIFGDRGDPNAPMSRLLQGLESLSQGGLGQIDPGRLNMLVRTTHAMSKQAGLTLDSAIALQQHSAGDLQDRGFSPLHAIQATHSAIAFGSAFAQEGGGAPAWGRGDVAEQTQIAIGRRSRAAVSEETMKLGAFMRLWEASGGFEEDSTAEALAQALQAEQEHFVDPNTGRTRQVLLSDPEFIQMMTSAKDRHGQDLGLTAGQVAQMVGNMATNEEAIHRYNLGEPAFQYQPEAVSRWMGSTFTHDFYHRLLATDPDRDRDQAMRVAERVGLAVQDRTRDMSLEELGDPAMRNDIAGEEVRQIMQAENLDMTEAQSRIAAQEMYAHLDTMVQQTPDMHREFRTGQNILVHIHRGTQQQARQVALQARLNAQLADDLGALGPGTPLQRGINYLQGLKAEDRDASMGRMLSSILGVDAEHVSDEFQNQAAELMEEHDAIQDLQAEIMTTEDPEHQAMLLSQFQEKRESLRERARSLSQQADAMGARDLDLARASHEDIDRTTRSIKRRGELQHELVDNKHLPAANLDPDDYRREWREFWETDSGQMLSKVSHRLVQQMDDVTARVIDDDKLLRHLGPEGFEILDDLRGTTTQLHVLARQHAGGDIGRLLAGHYDVGTPEDVRGEIEIEVADLLEGYGRASGRLQANLDEFEAGGPPSAVTGREVMNMLGFEGRYEDLDEEQRQQVIRNYHGFKHMAAAEEHDVTSKMEEYATHRRAVGQAARRYFNPEQLDRTAEQHWKASEGVIRATHGITTLDEYRDHLAIVQARRAVDGEDPRFQAFEEDELTEIRRVREEQQDIGQELSTLQTQEQGIVRYMANLEQALKDENLTPEVRERHQAALEQQQTRLEGTRAQITELETQRNAILEPLEEMAAARGLEAADLMDSRTVHRYTAEGLNEFLGQLHEFGEDKTVEEIKQDLNITNMEYLLMTEEARETFDAQVQKYQEAARMGSTGYVEKLMGRFGLSTDTTETKKQMHDLGAELSTPSGLAVVERVWDALEGAREGVDVTRERLTRRAARSEGRQGRADLKQAEKLEAVEGDQLAGLRTMLTDFQDEKAEDFMAKYNMNPERYDQFASQVQTLEDFGIAALIENQDISPEEFAEAMHKLSVSEVEAEREEILIKITGGNIKVSRDGDGDFEGEGTGHRRRV